MTAELVIYGAGRRDPVPLDPATMQFETRPATSCRGCLFDGQWWSVCQQAGELAVRAGLAECESGKVIYVARKIDPRQMKIEA